MNDDQELTEANHPPDNEVTAWAEQLHKPTTQEAARIRRVLYEVLEEELRPPTQEAPPRAAAALMADVHERQDVQAATRTIEECIDQGLASPRLLTCWRRHLFAEQYHKPCPLPKGVAEVRWRVAPPIHLQRFVKRLDIEIAPTLGGVLTAAAFTGPNRTRIVLAQDAIVSLKEAEFFVYHMALHAMAGHLADGEFGCWLEYQREAVDPRVVAILQDPAHSEEEAVMNDAASCLMDAHYASGRPLASLGRSLLQRALTRRITELPLIRAILGDRQDLHARIDAKVSAIYHPVADRSMLVANLLRPRLCFTQHIAIVREAWWRPVYLIWADPTGNLRRRLIPSRRVLNALGGRLDDIPDVSARRLGQYADEGILIDPTEVAAVRTALLRGTVPGWPILGGCLPGLERKHSSLDLPRTPQQSRLELPPPDVGAKPALDNGPGSDLPDATLVSGNAGGNAN